MSEAVYRVTWKSVEPAQEDHERVFTDIDQGYSFYEMMQRDANSYAVRWNQPSTRS